MTYIAGSPVALSVTTVGRAWGRLEPKRGGRSPHLRRSSGCKIEKNWSKYQLMGLLNFYYRARLCDSDFNSLYLYFLSYSGGKNIIVTSHILGGLSERPTGI